MKCTLRNNERGKEREAGREERAKENCVTSKKVESRAFSLNTEIRDRRDRARKKAEG